MEILDVIPGFLLDSNPSLTVRGLLGILGVIKSGGHYDYSSRSA